MVHELKMAIVDSIFQLHALHWSARRIARELGIDRGTVGRYLTAVEFRFKTSHSARRVGRLQNQPLSPRFRVLSPSPAVTILRPKIPESKPAISPAGSPCAATIAGANRGS